MGVILHLKTFFVNLLYSHWKKKNVVTGFLPLPKPKEEFHTILFSPRVKNLLNVTKTKFGIVIHSLKTHQAGTIAVIFISTVFFFFFLEATVFVLVRNPGYTDQFQISQLIHPVPIYFVN